jgi:hypothetical protein
VRSASRCVAAAALGALFFLSPGRADDGHLLGVVSSEYAHARSAAAAARGGVAGADAVQRQYDAARALALALTRAQPVSEGCGQLLRTLRAYARAQIEQAEGYDRRKATLAGRGRVRAREAEASIAAARASCRTGGRVSPERAPHRLVEPGPEEAFMGRVRARAPEQADDAILLVDGKRAGNAPVMGSFASFELANTRPGRHRLQVRFRRAGRIVGSTALTPAWLLPASAALPIRSSRVDAKLSKALARLGTSFAGYAAIAVEDVGERRSARWNADSRFPAASTVKLGVLVSAIARFGRSEVVRYDLEQMAHWSSNLAANRLVRLLGSGSVERGSTIVEGTLRALGGRRSTYTGSYRVGTAQTASGGEPPLVSFRVTTASDLAAAIATIHSAAAGDRRALRRSGLSVGEARLALGLLLGSRASGDNAGLVRPFVTATVPVARKEGWLADAHLTVAVVYPTQGPVVVSVLTYRSGLSLAQAQRLGRAVVLALNL